LQRLRRIATRKVSTAVCPVDLRALDSSPRDLLINGSSELKDNLLLNVPTARCRNSSGFAFTAGHYLVATLLPRPPRGYGGSLLEAFHQAWQPASAIEALGIDPSEGPGLIGLPAVASTMPWTSIAPSEMTARRSLWLERDARQYGLAQDICHGRSCHGPVSAEKGELEIRRLTEIWASMSRHGFVRSDDADGDITGRLVTNARGEWSVLINTGHHRAAVAAALGIPSVPIRFRQVPLKREEVDYWPQVVAGRIARAAALAIFDRIMRGDPPPGCRFDPASFAHNTRGKQRAKGPRPSTGQRRSR
jgi:hypothetical protein